MWLRFLIGALLAALDIACTHGAASRFKEQADTHAADTRRALSEPRINAEGIYLVTPSELVRSMSQYDAAIRWIGASVRVSGVVVHIGTSDEARVRRVPPTSTALLSVGPEKRGDPTPPTPESRRTACRV
jgi:hypothetical protein